MERRLYRSQHNRVFLGVCGGFGEYFNADPVIVRVIAVAITVITGFIPGILAYFILALVIPNEGSTAYTPGVSFQENISDMRDTSMKMGQEIRDSFDNRGTNTNPTLSEPRPSSRGALAVLGAIIIVAGIIILLGNVFSWFTRFLWPVLLIIVGILVIVLVFRRK